VPDQPRRPAGGLEADVLAALWRADGPRSPGDIRAELGGDLAYTTVMTILSRLYAKGLVTRERMGRAYGYAPAIEQADLAATKMRALLDSGTDSHAVLARFVGSLSAAEEKTLSALLRGSGRLRPR
jgi:predicted transcriptional regulator